MLLNAGDNRVEGNYIGTNANGTADLGNSGGGIYVLNAPNSKIGGAETGARNVISGNTGIGVNVSGEQSIGSRVQGNYIGTDRNDTEPLGNDGSGVFIAASNNTIESNAISGNAGHGVLIQDASGNAVSRNRIGGTTSLGNSLDGIAVAGTASIDSNLVGNEIYGNGDLGIDLGNDGVTPNDEGDTDIGPNNLQNFPVLESAVLLAGETPIKGTLNSIPNTTFTVQFFTSPEKDQSGHGEGKTYLGQNTVTTDASGDARFTDGVSATVPEGQFITAAATDPGGNTSEFSKAIVADRTPPTTTATRSQESNGNGWHKESVTVTLDATDGENGSGVKEITYKVGGGESVIVQGNLATVPEITQEGTTTITYRATDNSGNVEQEKTLTVKLDKTAPTVQCSNADDDWQANNVNIGCTANDGGSGLAQSGDASFDLSTSVADGEETDNAETDSRTVSDVAGNISTVGPIGGNKVDRKKPGITLTSPENNATYGLRETVAADYSCSDGGSEVKSCAGPVESGKDIETASVGNRSFEVRAADDAGNVATLSHGYTVVDDILPILELPGNDEGKIFAEATSGAGATVEYTATATDDDPENPEMTCDPASGETFPLGETTVECHATDEAGNRADGSFTVVVRDTTPPTLDLPDDLTREAAGANGAAVEYEATASDLVDETVTVGCVPASGETFPLGETTVNCSATDEAENEATGSFKITVSDTTAPLMECGSPDGEWHKDDVSITCTASDAGSGLENPGDSEFTLSTTVPNGTETSDARTGSHEVCDAAGNCATAGPISGIKVDKKAPAITATTPEEDAVYGLRQAIAADYSCSDGGSDVKSCIGTVADGENIETTSVGSKSFTVTAADNAGNTASLTRNYQVGDDIPPELDLPGNEEGKVFAEATSGDGAEVTYTATATDDDPPNPSVECDPASGSLFPLGETKVNCSATDGAGNEATGSFTVVVHDTTAPTLDLPEDISSEATGPDGATVEYEATASDAVDGDNVPVSCDPASGATFARGDTTVECSATDEAGNEATGNFKVTIADATGPSITCDEPDGLWHKENVTLECEATDNGSGLADPDDAGFTLKTNVPEGEETTDAQTDSKEVCDTDGNCATAGPISGNKVDRKGPSISISSPAEGASHERGSEVAAEYSCSDAGSGPGSCSGPVENGKNIDTSSLGEKTFTVEATDAVGNASSLGRGYTVVDGSAPDTEITSGPEGPTRNDEPTFTFTGSDGATPAEELTFSHRLNDGEWSEYSSATSVTLGGETGLDRGSYTFEVRAKDPADNVDDSPASREFVVGSNERPTAEDDSATTDEDRTVNTNVLANDRDPDRDRLRVTIVSPPANGRASVSIRGVIRYTPEANYNGDDSITYRISDGKGGTDTATLSIRVRPVNDAPVSRKDTAQTGINQPVDIDVLANDTDAEGDSLSIASTRLSRGGNLSLDSDRRGIRFTPARNFTGVARFTYQATDGESLGRSAVVEVRVRR